MTVIALGIAVMLGDGCCAFVSISRGEQKRENAVRSAGNDVTLCVLASEVLTAGYLIFAEPILTAFGGKVNAETFALSKEYFFWIALRMPFYMFGQAMNPVIRADGSPNFAMESTLLGAMINIILDPIFIFVFKWGMMGAAVATVIGQIVMTVLAVWHLCRMKTILVKLADFRLRGKVLWKTLSLGLCSFLAQISLVAAINNMVRWMRFSRGSSMRRFPWRLWEL